MYLGQARKDVHTKIPGGRAGTVKTLELMRQLAHKGSRDVTVREAAVRILRNAGVRGHDFRGERDALFRFVSDSIRFVRDPYGAELLQTPRYTLEHGFGDCDDKSTLLAALLRAVGHPGPIRFRAVGETPRAFSHVYVVARDGDRDLALDATRAGTPLGWQLPHPALAMDAPA